MVTVHVYREFVCKIRVLLHLIMTINLIVLDKVSLIRSPQSFEWPAPKDLVHRKAFKESFEAFFRILKSKPYERSKMFLLPLSSFNFEATSLINFSKTARADWILINTQLFLIFVIYLFGLIEWETQISEFTEFWNSVN